MLNILNGIVTYISKVTKYNVLQVTGNMKQKITILISYLYRLYCTYMILYFLK